MPTGGPPLPSLPHSLNTFPPPPIPRGETEAGGEPRAAAAASAPPWPPAARSRPRSGSGGRGMPGGPRAAETGRLLPPRVPRSPSRPFPVPPGRAKSSAMNGERGGSRSAFPGLPGRSLHRRASAGRGQVAGCRGPPRCRSLGVAKGGTGGRPGTRGPMARGVLGGVTYSLQRPPWVLGVCGGAWGGHPPVSPLLAGGQPAPSRRGGGAGGGCGRAAAVPRRGRLRAGHLGLHQPPRRLPGRPRARRAGGDPPATPPKKRSLRAQSGCIPSTPTPTSLPPGPKSRS